MTIPKFRVYDKVECMMITTSDYEDLSDLFCFLKADADTGYCSELMQSTGLADVNGKEIFEGDIVQTERYFGGFTDFEMFKGVVKQLEGAWMIVTDNNAVPVFSEIEENIVIGNVWENKELLEKH